MSDISLFMDTVTSKLSPEQVFEGHFAHDWKKEHRKWRGKCPWHKSKSGNSFYLNTETLLWRCPACEVGGGAAHYLHQINGGTGTPKGPVFTEIAKQLGAMVGEQYPEKEYSAEQVARFEKIEERRSLVQCVLDSSVKKLWSEDGKAARQYLNGRGLNDEQIKDLGLGLYPTPESVLSVVTRNGSDIDKASELGLLYQGASEVFCPLTGYVVFPWNDDRGNLLSLYGRWPGKAPGNQPKTKSLKNPGFDGDRWLKTKASPLFLDRALDAKQDNVVVVEGLFDVAVLQAYGENRAIAWVAAKASAEQITTLKRRQVKNVCFCLDPDGAGDKGTLAGIKSLTNEGIGTFVAPRLPEGQDPDEFVLKHGIDEWRLRLKESVHGLRYAARAIASKHGDKPTDGQLSEILSEAKDYADSLNAPHEVANFFWPEFEKLTGANSGDAAPEYDEVLDEVERIEESESDESKYDWKVKILATEKGLRRYGITSDYLRQQTQARRDRSGELEFEDAHDILESADERSWIIAGLIPAGSTVLQAADGGVGKTTLAYQQAGAVASGYRWSGMPTAQGKVLIVQVDEPKGDTREKLQESGFHNVPRGQVQFLRRWKFTQTRQLFQHMQKTKPCLVVIDSITAAMANTGVDLIASNAADKLYDLRNFAEGADWPCSFLVLHHTNGQGGVRDSRSFSNNVSEVQVLTKGKGDETLSNEEYVLDIIKSRAGLQGKHVLHRDDAEFLWSYRGLKDAPANYESVLQALRDRPGVTLTPAKVAEIVGIYTNEAKSVLEQCRKLCIVKSRIKEYVKRDSGLPGLLRLYWVEGGSEHPEAVDVNRLEKLYQQSAEIDSENIEWDE